MRGTGWTVQPGRPALTACLAVAKRLDVPAVASDGTCEVLDLGVEVLPFR